jgi:hypothetical protein
MRITGVTLPDQQTANTTCFEGRGLAIATMASVASCSDSRAVRASKWYDHSFWRLARDHVILRGRVVKW